MANSSEIKNDGTFNRQYDNSVMEGIITPSQNLFKAPPQIVGERYNLVASFGNKSASFFEESR